MRSYRQGDIYIKEVQEIPETDGINYYDTENLNSIRKENNERVLEEIPIILAYGESTGHKHAIHRNTLLVKEKGSNRFFIIILKETDLVHEEHDKITLPMGKYEVIRQREYSPTEIRRVAD